MLLSERINSNDAERTIKCLKLLTHPMRVNVVELLLQGKGLSVTDIYEKLNILQAEASHHLALLKDYGIIYKVRDGKKSIYSINADDFYKTLNMVESLIGPEYRNF